MPSAPTKSELVHTASAEERAAAGKAAREKVPRSSHGEWEPPARRRDPVKVLEDQAKSRVPELVPIRYGRMLASPFTFYRGAAAIMAMDLAKTPQSGLRVQACGDAHLSNFGCLRRSGSPSGGETSTTSTRPCRGPGNGTSSASRLASRSPGATATSPRRRPAPPSSARPAPTARRSASSPRCETSTSGTRDWTSRASWRRLPRSPPPRR